MKTFAILALTLLLTAAAMTGCGCTNQNMDNTSAPTVLPTNEEIWDNTETNTRDTTETTLVPGITDTTGSTDATVGTETQEATRGINETQVQNHVNAQQELKEKIQENQKAGRSSQGNGETGARRMIPGTR